MNLTDPAALQAFLSRHGLTARKGLGQHFLCSENAVQGILNCLDGIRGVLEIGPGPGILTGPLTSQVETVIALEIDPEMAKVLAESAPSARVLRRDALALDLAEVLSELPSPRSVVSNLPYYITGPLVQKIAEAREHYSKAVLMMQKEVAERFMAPPGNSARGSISVYLQAQFEIRKVLDVPRTAFIPPPKVDSRVLELKPFTTCDSPFTIDNSRFTSFVRQGFAQPRKTLVNNLSGAFDRETVLHAIENAGLKPSVRPHELEMRSWIEIAAILKSSWTA